MAVVAVFNQKGGVGKTTTCLNVTAALHNANLLPVALDLDPQAHLSLASGLKPVASENSLAAFFKQESPLTALMHETSRGWKIIPSSLELAKIEALIGSNPQAATLLKQGLREELTQSGEPILIDCCPTLGVLTLNALLAADRVLIPVSADFLSLQGVHRIDNALTALETKLNRKFARRIVVTRFDARRKLSYQIYDELKEKFGELVCNTRIGETVALAASPMHGQDVFTFAPHSPGAADYYELTRELWESGFFAST